jgi:hypothetical protein
MKPCRKRRKQITWLAINALDTAQAVELDRHFQECSGCRGYFDEIQRVQQRVSLLPSLVASQSAAELSPVRDGGHIRQPTRYRRHEYSPRFQVSQRLGWLLALSGAGVAALILWFTAPEQVHPPGHSGAAVTTEISSTRVALDSLPTFAHYRAIGIQSLDRLDDLLAQQAQKAPHSPLCPTAGTLDPANLPD